MADDSGTGGPSYGTDEGGVRPEGGQSEAARQGGASREAAEGEAGDPLHGGTGGGVAGAPGT